jgi:signal transduction histidine kinase
MTINNGEVDFDDLPDGLVIADEHGLVTVFNRTAARVTGIDPIQVLGKPLAEALPLEDLEGRGWWGCVDPYGGLAIRTGHPEIRLLLPGGRDVLVTARYVRSRTGVGAERRPGEITQILVGLRDTSSRARLDRRHADLIATVAHELRSPLTSVKGFTATLLAKWERFSDDQRKLMLESVNTDADRVTRLISELLDIARIDSGRLQLARYSVDLLELIDHQLAGMVAAGVDEEQFVLNLNEVPRVYADADKVRQVLANLLENAVRHGGGRIHLTVARAADPDAGAGADTGDIAGTGTGDIAGTSPTAPGLVEVVIADEGPGIPEEMMDRVFTRFWRGNRRGGTGLGLYIVKGIVEAHGGTITVGRAPSGGASFRFTLPEVDPALSPDQG